MKTYQHILTTLVSITLLGGAVQAQAGEYGRGTVTNAKYIGFQQDRGMSFTDMDGDLIYAYQGRVNQDTLYTGTENAFYVEGGKGRRLDYRMNDRIRFANKHQFGNW